MDEEKGRGARATISESSRKQFRSIETTGDQSVNRGHDDKMEV